MLACELLCIIASTNLAISQLRVESKYMVRVLAAIIASSALVMFAAPAANAGAIKYCAEPDTSYEPDTGDESVDCGVFLGTGDQYGVGSGGNAPDPIVVDGVDFFEIIDARLEFDEPNPFWGEWEVAGAELMAIKGATGYALYDVSGLDGAGWWSVYFGVPKNQGGKIPSGSNVRFYSSTPVSEPGILGLLGLGLIATVVARRRRTVV